MVDELINDIKNLSESNLISVARFGSEGEPNNIIFVMDKLSFDVLLEIKPIIIKHRKKTNVVPLIFTKEELFDGADVFPLEFLDIKYPHETLYGEEIIDKIKFDKSHVRRQLEFELRSKLIHLRENYIWVKKDKELRDLLVSAVPSLMPLFYGLLFLKDIKTPTKLDELFKIVGENYKINLSILKKIKQIREEKIKLSEDESKKYIKELMTLLRTLTDIVDMSETQN